MTQRDLPYLQHVLDACFGVIASSFSPNKRCGRYVANSVSARASSIIACESSVQ